jgi:hypothetical protein
MAPPPRADHVLVLLILISLLATLIAVRLADTLATIEALSD